MAKLVWNPVTQYSDGTLIPVGTVPNYKVYWKTPTSGYNNLDVMDVVGSTELELSFLPAGHYDLAASCYIGSNESVRSMDLPFVNIPPASPSGLYIL